MQILSAEETEEVGGEMVRSSVQSFETACCASYALVRAASRLSFLLAVRRFWFAEDEAACGALHDKSQKRGRWSFGAWKQNRQNCLTVRFAGVANSSPACFAIVLDGATTCCPIVASSLCCAGTIRCHKDFHSVCCRLSVIL